MLTFFRRIRKGLLASGATSKYLLYAIGEIALVVIGILIALQINNWNEDRKKVDTIKVYLQNLAEDLENDLENFKYGEINSTFRYYSTQYLIQLSGEPVYNPEADGHRVEEWKASYLWNNPIPKEYNREFIQLAFLWTHRVEMSEKTSSSIEVLRQTSEYSFFKNELIKDAIDNYYNARMFRFGPEAKGVVRSIIRTWQDELMDEGILNSTPFVKGDPILILKNNPSLSRKIEGIG